MSATEGPKRLNVFKLIVLALILSFLFGLIWQFKQDSKPLSNSANENLIEFYLSGTNTFRNEKWIINKASGIAMSYENNSGSFYDGYTVRFSSLKRQGTNEEEKFGWVGEFFCEPDDVVILNTNGNYDVSYLPYLDWRKDFFVDKTGNLGRVSVTRTANDGEATDLFETKYLDQNDDMKLDISHDYSIYPNRNISKSTITIVNKYDTTVSLDYIIQDAAFMHFPSQNSVGVTPIMFQKDNLGEVDTRYNIKSNSKDKLFFSGSYRKSYDILAGYFTTDPSAILGSTNTYVGVARTEASETKEHRAILKKEGELPDVIHKLKDAKPRAKDNSELANRYLIFPVKDLKPGEEKVLEYYRVMIDKSDVDPDMDENTWAKEVNTLLNSQLN